MNRASKLIVFVSNLVALWLVAMLVSRGFPPILIPAIAAFTASLVSALLFGEIAVTVILSLVYCFPAICIGLLHGFVFSYYSIWLMALCGAMLPRSVGSKWAFPAFLVVPLVLWALVLALSWPIVVLRELDFVPTLLNPNNTLRAILSQSPEFVTVWIGSVASIATTGLLLLDWLFLMYGPDRLSRFESRVIWPMCAGAVVAAGVAVYQSMADMLFLNSTLFGAMGRTVGTMRDANAFGSAIALWVPVAAAGAIDVAARRRKSVSAMLALAGFVLGVAVWTSGSRTALLAAVVGIIVLVGHTWRFVKAREAVAGICAAAILISGIVYFAPATTTGPLTRIRRFLPTFSGQDVRFAAEQLWARDMYGTAALKMIAEHPMVGIGVGGFYYQFPDTLYLINRTQRPQDNAQNWYRQQLAELGLLGSAGWIAWMCMFLWMLIRRGGPGERRPIVGAVKGALAGLGLASLLGIPTQDTADSVSFIVLACWCLKLLAVDRVTGVDQRSHRAAMAWAATIGLLVCFLGGTLYSATTDLRPPRRALRVDFPYEYGFTPDQDDPAMRWSGRKAVEVFPADKRWLKLVIGAVAPDADQHPVEVKIWLDRHLVLHVHRHGNFPITRWIRMPKYQTPMMMEIAVDRTWRPADFGFGSDTQERGVAIGNLMFADEDPPKGSLMIEHLSIE